MQQNTTIPTVRVVAIVDELGYLTCARCTDVCSADRGYVWADSYPHNGEACDSCGRCPVESVAVRELKQGDNVIVAGSVWTIANEPYFHCGYIRCTLDSGYGRTGYYQFRADTTVPVCA